MKKKVDLSKLIIRKKNELRWDADIEEEIIIPEEQVSNKTIKKTAVFHYYKDRNNNYWLANCEVPDDYQRQGIGSLMIKRAIMEYGQVYFSNASRLEFNTKHPEHGYDSSYLDSQGWKFVEALIRKKIIPNDWLRFPEI
ncbi:MAG: GNAT family N-acetyltransferase [Bacteroidota bacterium]